MLPTQANPFPTDRERREIWQMLVERDTDAYLAADWGAVAADFIPESFYGIDAQRRPNPDEWRIAFATLAAYRDEWLRQAAATARKVDPVAARAALLNAVTLVDIEFAGDYAIARKKFHGSLPNLDGSQERLHWQTLYICRRHQGRWKISSFVGYLPYDMHGGPQT